MPLLLKLFAVKAIGTLIGGIVLLTKSGPGFDKIVARSIGDTLVCETILKNGLSKGLDEIIMSGSEVIITFHISFLEREEGGEVYTVIKREIVHSVSFHPASSKFMVLNDSDSSSFTELDGARAEVSRIRARLLPIPKLKDNSFYSLKISAVLNTIEIEALGNKQYDLNAFWNFKIPKASLNWISGKEMVKR